MKKTSFNFSFDRLFHFAELLFGKLAFCMAHFEYVGRCLAQPIEIAIAILLLASDISSYMTGQISGVSGSYSTVG